MLNLFGKKSLKTEALEFADQLDLVDYFSFVSGKKQDVKRKFIEACNTFQTFLPVLNDDLGGDKIISLDHRSYYAEATRLYELDFFKDFLERIKPTLELLNIPFRIGRIDGGWDSEKLEYSISVFINDNHYELLAGFHTGFLGYSVFKIAEMINDVLTINDSNNRVYLTGQGEIVIWHFLTNEQFECASNHYKKMESKPMKIHEWFKVAEKSHMVFFRNQQ